MFVYICVRAHVLLCVCVCSCVFCLSLSLFACATVRVCMCVCVCVPVWMIACLRVVMCVCHTSPRHSEDHWGFVSSQHRPKPRKRKREKEDSLVFIFKILKPDSEGQPPSLRQNLCTPWHTTAVRVYLRHPKSLSARSRMDSLDVVSVY